MKGSLAGKTDLLSELVPAAGQTGCVVGRTLRACPTAVVLSQASTKAHNTGKVGDVLVSLWKM